MPQKFIETDTNLSKTPCVRYPAFRELGRESSSYGEHERERVEIVEELALWSISMRTRQQSQLRRSFYLKLPYMKQRSTTEHNYENELCSPISAE